MDIGDETLKQEFGYHYTSLDTLLKILDNAHERRFTMHASGVFTMNDPSEFKHGFEKMLENLLKLEKELKIEDDKLKLSKYWDNYEHSSPNSWYDSQIRIMKKNFIHPFVISLSRCRDFLPLWRMYGDNGMGVALKIDYHIPCKNAAGEENPLSLNLIRVVDVVYDKKPLHRIVGHLVKREYLHYIQDVKNITNEGAIAERQRDAIFQMLLFTAPYTKNKAYSYEEESRITTAPKDIKDIRFKKGLKDNLIPYVEYDLPIESLKEIIVGPCADFESVEQCLTTKMGQIEMTGMKISQSDVPYRN